MATASPYPYLDVSTWRRLLAHAALLHTAADQLGELHLCCLSSDAVRVRLALEQLKIAAAEASKNASDDGEAVQKTIEYWCTALDSIPALTSIGADESILLHELRVRAPRAVPDDLFGRLFAAVTHHAANVYEECWVRPELSLLWLREHPRTPVDDYGITVCALPGPPPEIKLQIHLDGFGPAAYAAVPWFLFHECVCHVPSRQGGKQSNSSPFAEGFMDWAARFFFKLWMLLVDCDLSLAAMEHFTLVDRVVTRPETSEGAARIRGRRAAEQVVKWLVNDHGGDRAEAEAWVARLAVELNCCDTSLAAKDRFVVALNSEWSEDLTECMSAVLTRSAPVCSVIVQMHGN